MQAGRKLTKEERDRYSGFDKITSLALMFAGTLGLAEAAGVVVSSLLTVGGIGGKNILHGGWETLCTVFLYNYEDLCCVVSLAQVIC